jgi:PAS domain S-box-containing protein
MQYAHGPDTPPAVPDELRWSEFRYRTLAQTQAVAAGLGSVAEETVRQSEAILRAVTENTPDWLFLLDEALHVRFMNRPFGPNRPEDVLGRAFLDFIPQGVRPTLEEIYQKALVSGIPARLELHKPGPDGTPGNFEHRIMPVIESGVVRALTVAVTDVTERKRAENELRTQVRILETMQEGVVLIDPIHHAIRLTNPTFDRMFGYASTELSGRSIEPLFSMLTVQRRRLARALRDRTKTGEIVPVEFECARRDGTRFVAACVVTPLTINGFEHWLAVLNDVTERKQLEREIIEIANREQQRIGNDLHDGLGQDLTGIALMLRGVAAQLRRESSAAHQDVEDVIGLVNNAIDSTRTLARGLSPVGGGRGDLAAAIQTLGARIGERFSVQVAFHVNFSEALRLSETAAAHVYRIVQEALTNVARHSDARHVSIRLNTCDGELQFQVDDDGCGLPPLAADRTGGLGLKIMRYRAQMLGGDLVIESNGNGGTSVRCSCPLDFTIEAGQGDTE